MTQEPGGNIIIIPTVVGHVVNFGDTSMVDDKFLRLRTFYRKVLPTVGWQHYDTIAVKWRGQVVATRRHKRPEPVQLITIEEQSGILDRFDDETTQCRTAILTIPTHSPYKPHTNGSQNHSSHRNRIVQNKRGSSLRRARRRTAHPCRGNPPR